MSPRRATAAQPRAQGLTCSGAETGCGGGGGRWGGAREGERVKGLKGKRRGRKERALRSSDGEGGSVSYGGSKGGEG